MKMKKSKHKRWSREYVEGEYMCQSQNGSPAPTADSLLQSDQLNPEEVHLSPEERSHLRLIRRLEEGQIQLGIQANKAMKCLIERTISDNPLFRVLLLFNYIQWIILLPGLVTLYYFGWKIGLLALAVCFAIGFFILERVKRLVLRGGVHEFIVQDLGSLNALYAIGAIRFRIGKKGKWIKHPRDWQEVVL